jgi:hypothetical protein
MLLHTACRRTELFIKCLSGILFTFYSHAVNIRKYMNMIKLLKRKANTVFDKQCLATNIITVYVMIKVSGHKVPVTVVRSMTRLSEIFSH